MGSDNVWAGSVLGRVRSLGQVTIGSLGVGDVNSALAMGRSEPGLVFIVLVSLGSLWQRI